MGSVKILPSMESFVEPIGKIAVRHRILGEKTLSQRECIQEENKTWIAIDKAKLERWMEGVGSMGKEREKERQCRTCQSTAGCGLELFQKCRRLGSQTLFSPGDQGEMTVQ